MKKLLTLILSLTPALLFSQELTADTAAVEPSAWEQITVYAVNAFVTFVISIIGLVLTGVYDAIRKYLATARYGQEMGIIIESVRTAALRKAKERGIEYSALIREIGGMYTDLQITPAEKLRLQEIRDDIRALAREIAAEQLKQVRGLAKDAAGKWVAERIDLVLGELVSHALGLPTI
jgi:hypothetical protein